MPSDLKTKGRFGFCHILILRLTRVRRKRKKNTRFHDNFFCYQILEAFTNIGTDFNKNINKHFWTVINTYEVTLLIC